MPKPTSREITCEANLAGSLLEDRPKRKKENRRGHHANDNYQLVNKAHMDKRVPRNETESEEIINTSSCTVSRWREGLPS